ncbi:hypothetical protein AAMO2058_001015800 [Amorphochlora amoebiformis]
MVAKFSFPGGLIRGIDLNLCSQGACCSSTRPNHLTSEKKLVLGGGGNSFTLIQWHKSKIDHKRSVHRIYDSLLEKKENVGKKMKSVIHVSPYGDEIMVITTFTTSLALFNALKLNHSVPIAEAITEFSGVSASTSSMHPTHNCGTTPVDSTDAFIFEEDSLTIAGGGTFGRIVVSGEDTKKISCSYIALHTESSEMSKLQTSCSNAKGCIYTIMGTCSLPLFGSRDSDSEDESLDLLYMQWSSRDAIEDHFSSPEIQKICKSISDSAGLTSDEWYGGMVVWDSLYDV